MPKKLSRYQRHDQILRNDMDKIKRDIRVIEKLIALGLVNQNNIEIQLELDDLNRKLYRLKPSRGTT